MLVTVSGNRTAEDGITSGFPGQASLPSSGDPPNRPITRRWATRGRCVETAAFGAVLAQFLTQSLDHY